MRKAVRDLIIGRNYFIESHTEYRAVLMSGWYAILTILVAGVYMAVDALFRQEPPETLMVFALCMTTGIASLVLHRQRRHSWANVIIFCSLGAVVFVLASSEAVATGAFLYFLIISVAAFALYGYARKKLAFAISGCMLILFLLSLHHELSPLSFRHYSADYMRVSLIINFIAALLSLVIISLLVAGLHHYHARQIQQQHDELSKANVELDRFVYSTSHDLRAPISSVMGLINLASINKQETDYYLGLMKKRLQSLDDFIRDITDYSRNNRLAVEKKNVAVSCLAMDVWEGLRFIEGADRIRFKMDIDPQLEVLTDPSRIKIVLGNLLSNAIRYHDFSKADPFVRVAAFKNQHAFYLEVHDNGQGIDNRYKQKIFDMFFRAHENSKGSGLGLYIVKEALLKVEGAIDVETTLHQGTTFKVRLPLKA